MSNKKLDRLFQIMNEFTHMRKTGTNRDDAWYLILDTYEDELVDGDVKMLLKLAKDWERREGHQYRFVSSTSTQQVASHQQQAAQRQSAIQPIGQRPPSGGVTGELDPSKVREHQQEILEQVLDQSGGFDIPVSADSGTTPLAPITDDNDLEIYFGDETTLLLYFKGFSEPLQAKLRPEQEIIIGRTTENTAMSPDLDLNQVRGEQYGVSRMHAAIKRENNRLLIADLGSRNHTFINGDKLYEDEIRTLSRTDEIWFGRLMCRIRYHHS